MQLSESLAVVLLVYWLAKIITRFIAIRIYVTPLVFIVVQVIAIISGVTFSRESSGPHFTMWTCGIAIIIFIAVQVVLNHILVKKSADNYTEIYEWSSPCTTAFQFCEAISGHPVIQCNGQKLFTPLL